MPPVAALGPFASAGMLLWGLAAAAPILIHFWSKRQHNEAPWAAMQHLLAAVRRNARRIRIEQLLLLLVRVVTVLLLALALADPILPLFPTLAGSPRGGGQTHLALVIDGSYSMAYRRGEKSRFEVAQELASRLVEELTQGDGVTLILMGEPPQAVIGAPAFDPADVIEEVESLRPPQAGARLSSTLAELQAVLQRAERQYPRLTAHRICFFTDLGRTTWDEATTDPCRSQFSQLADRAELALVDLGEPDSPNAAVVQLDARDQPATVGHDVVFEAEIRQFGAPQRVRRRVEFFVDGQRVDEEEVETAGDGRAAVSFTHSFSSPGEHQVEARLNADSLEIDDHRWLSVPVRESIRVLCVSGGQDAARYVALALEPDKSDRPRVRAEVRSESALLESDLSVYDCVVLCNVGRFGRDEANILFEYVAHGGSLITFLGDQVQPESYNQELGGELSGKRVLPARVGGVVAGGPHRLDPLGYRHPLAAPFRGYEGSGLVSTPVWTYMKLTPYDADAAKIALAFQNRDPAIIEERILRGRSIMAATAASPLSLNRSANRSTPWTALAYWPSFVPLVQEMRALAVRSRVAGRNVLVGEPLEGALPGSVADVPLTVAARDGRGERVRVRVDGQSGHWAYDGAWWSGIYEAQFGPPVERTELFAVNVNPRESNLDRLDPGLLPHPLRREIEAKDAERTAASLGRRPQFFRSLLGLVLVLLLTETWLARRFGAARA